MSTLKIITSKIVLARFDVMLTHDANDNLYKVDCVDLDIMLPIHSADYDDLNKATKAFNRYVTKLLVQNSSKY